MNSTISQCFEHGGACLSGRTEAFDEKPWNPHPAFKGVSLKHLVTGADTGGALSCHMVRVDPGCVLKTHTHNPQWELHEVVEGSGEAMLGDETAPYAPGKVAVIPCGQAHRVQAGDQGLILFAKFFPALI